MTPPGDAPQLLAGVDRLVVVPLGQVPAVVRIVRSDLRRVEVGQRGGRQQREIDPTVNRVLPHLLVQALVKRHLELAVRHRVEVDPAQPGLHCNHRRLPLVHPALTHAESEPFKRSRILVRIDGRKDKRVIGHDCGVEVVIDQRCLHREQRAEFALGSGETLAETTASPANGVNICPGSVAGTAWNGCTCAALGQDSTRDRGDHSCRRAVPGRTVPGRARTDFGSRACRTSAGSGP
jgi:hypothetical protein